MPLTLSQCLLFIVPGVGEEHFSLKERNAWARRMKTSRAEALPTIKAYALFSQAFKEKHPEVLEEFQQISIQILTNQNMSSLLLGKDKKLDVFELLIDESRSFDWENVWGVVDFDNYDILEHLCPGSFPDFHTERYVTNAGPAIDDVNLQVIRYLLTNKVDIRCCNNDESLLHLAAKRGPDSFVNLVLEHGLNIEVERKDGATPLQLAAADERISIVKLLLERGANLQAKTNDGRNALHLAARSGSATMIEYLIISGVPVDIKDNKGYTALNIAVQERYHVDAVEMLLQYGADVNSKSYAITPITTAALDGQAELVKMLARYGAKVGGKGECYSSVLSGTRDAKSPDLFQYLLENYFLDPESIKETLIIREFIEFWSGVYANTYFRNSVTEYVNFKARLQILARHIVKIPALALYPVIDEVDVTPLWSEFMPTTLSVYKSQCQEEVSRLKTETVGDSTLPFYDILGKDANKVAGYLRNDSISRITVDELERRFPIYGSILMHHLQKGKEKKVMMEEGVKICEVLFFQFKELPDEIEERIISYLTVKELLILKTVCGHLIKTKA